MADLFGSPLTVAASVADMLEAKHYLGPANRGFAWDDELGVMVFTNPNSRHLPQQSWFELVRWCLVGGENAGTRQWSRFVRHARRELPNITTIVSYSDPSAGHTGALYRACGWLWAPTWQRLRPPPSGNGSWDKKKGQSVKDRWIYPLRRDDEREAVLSIKDVGVLREFPWAQYVEPTWRRTRCSGGGGDWWKWFGDAVRDANIRAGSIESDASVIPHGRRGRKSRLGALDGAA
jgi:hypothetical protein